MKASRPPQPPTPLPSIPEPISAPSLIAAHPFRCPMRRPLPPRRTGDGLPRPHVARGIGTRAVQAGALAALARVLLQAHPVGQFRLHRLRRPSTHVGPPRAVAACGARPCVRRNCRALRPPAQRRRVGPRPLDLRLPPPFQLNLLRCPLVVAAIAHAPPTALRGVARGLCRRPTGPALLAWRRRPAQRVPQLAAQRRQSPPCQHRAALPCRAVARSGCVMQPTSAPLHRFKQARPSQTSASCANAGELADAAPATSQNGGRQQAHLSTQPWWPQSTLLMKCGAVRPDNRAGSFFFLH